jgi:hypothetical protein
MRNALAAVGSGITLGATLESLRGGLEGFEGVERRFQRLGAVRGVQVVDDYAHHPTEITATLDAARAAFPGRRLIAAFQPHLFTRTRDFADAFGVALARADLVFLTEIYPAREQPLPGITSALVATRCGGRGTRRSGWESAWHSPMPSRPPRATVTSTDAWRRRHHAHGNGAAAAPWSAAMNDQDDSPTPRRPRWGRRVAALAMLAAITGPFWARPLLSRLEFFRVRRVEVRDARFTPPEEIRRRLAIDTTFSIWNDLSRSSAGWPSILNSAAYALPGAFRRRW